MVIIDPRSISTSDLSKILKKNNINTIFYSNKYKKLVLNLYNEANKNISINNRNKKTSTKSKILNLTYLINFDSNNPPIIPVNHYMSYEKLINIGRYIENYSIDSLPVSISNFTSYSSNTGSFNLWHHFASLFFDVFGRKSVAIANQDFCATIIASKKGHLEISLNELISDTSLINNPEKLFKCYKSSEPLLVSKRAIIINIFTPLIYGLCVHYQKNINTPNFILLKNSTTSTTHPFSALLTKN